MTSFLGRLTCFHNGFKLEERDIYRELELCWNSLPLEIEHIIASFRKSACDEHINTEDE